MKKAFLIFAGVLFVFGTNTDALAHSKTKMPVKSQVGYHANGVDVKAELISGRHHRRHNQGHYRGHRHGRHFGHGYRDHRHGYNKHYYGGRDLYRLYKPYGNYYSGRHFYRGRGYNRHNKHNRHDRGYRQDRHHSPKHRH
jgi:hypothetical protein